MNFRVIRVSRVRIPVLRESEKNKPEYLLELVRNGLISRQLL